MYLLEIYIKARDKYIIFFFFLYRWKFCSDFGAKCSGFFSSAFFFTLSFFSEFVAAVAVNVADISIYHSVINKVCVLFVWAAQYIIAVLLCLSIPFFFQSLFLSDCLFSFFLALFGKCPLFNDTNLQYSILLWSSFIPFFLLLLESNSVP